MSGTPYSPVVIDSSEESSSEELQEETSRSPLKVIKSQRHKLILLANGSVSITFSDKS